MEIQCYLRLTEDVNQDIGNSPSTAESVILVDIFLDSKMALTLPQIGVSAGKERAQHTHTVRRKTNFKSIDPFIVIYLTAKLYSSIKTFNTYKIINYNLS